MVDDDPITRTILTESLTGLGYETSSATDGCEAWPNVEAGEGDLVITGTPHGSRFTMDWPIEPMADGKAAAAPSLAREIV